jgi:transcriptional regulator with XRE-family HTH domain
VPTPREQLACILRQSRLDAGFESHGALAVRLSVSRPVVSKAENPAQPIPSDALLAAWAGATGAALDQLTDLAQRCKSGTPEWFMPYLQAEARADILRCWSPVLVPGLLQTESYARAVLSAEQPRSPVRLAELVAARMDRQQVLSCAHLTAVIDHLVLHRCLGSAAIMAEQCAYLATMAEQPDIALHVVPDGTNTGLWGAFDIATGDGSFTLRLETMEDVTTNAPGQIDRAMQAYERILGSAMPRAESLDFVRTQEETWKTRI